MRPDVTVPVGRYDWTEYAGQYQTDQSRAIAGALTYTGGGFWDGTEAGHRRRADHQTLVTGCSSTSRCSGTTSTCERRPPSSSTTLVNTRVSYAFSTRMFLDSLIQYRADRRQLSANIRFNFIHHPLSDFFIVYNDDRFIDSGLRAGRGLIVKYTQMFAF